MSGPNGSASSADTIQLNGDTWRVVARGVEQDGKTYCHLASTTNFRQQRNGRVPVQMCDFIPNEVLP